jgi:hypothetical protein
LPQYRTTRSIRIRIRVGIGSISIGIRLGSRGCQCFITFVTLFPVTHG